MDKQAAINSVDKILVTTILLGESMQVAEIFGLMNYNFITGHLSDFGLAAYATHLGLKLTEGKSRAARLIGATASAALFTLREYFPIIPIENTTDNWDVVSYWAAAAAVTCVFEYITNYDFRCNVNSAFQKISPSKAESSGLEGVVDPTRHVI